MQFGITSATLEPGPTSNRARRLREKLSTSRARSAYVRESPRYTAATLSPYSAEA